MSEGNSTINRSCPACDLPNGVSVGRKDGFQMLACASCATLFTDHLPATTLLHDYGAYYTNENLNVVSSVEKQVDEIVSTFAAYRKSNRLLDVGCGAGTFMEAARGAGWEAIGLEVSPVAVDHVRALGFEAYCGELEQANLPAGSFDVVIASEVFEHVRDPKGLIAGIARVLRGGGLLWATTPNGRGASARVLGVNWSVVCPPDHLQLFSVAGISRLLSVAEFQRVSVAKHGLNPYEILHAFRTRGKQQESGNGQQNASTFDDRNRNESALQLNEVLAGSPLRRLLKQGLNGLLDAGSLGDSLKIRAVR